MSAGTDFADLHAGPSAFLLPNAWDVASALLLADAGFPAVGTTSLGITAAAGLRDGMGAGLAPTIALVEALANRLSVPLTVDLEGGYSEDPAAVAELASRLCNLGVAGINLEDGRGDGSLRPLMDHAAVIEAVVATAPSLFVNARTDTWWLSIGPVPERMPETVRRLETYRAAGAHGAFVPGLPDLGAVRSVASQVALPLNVLWTPGLSVAAAGAVRVSTGSHLYRRALGQAIATAQQAATGVDGSASPVDYAHLQKLLGS